VLESLATPGPGPQPSDEEVSARGRAALEAFVQDVLFNPSNRDGSRFRGEFLAWRDPSARDFLRAELLAAASSWSPEAPGWERHERPEAVSFSGHIGELKTTVTFQRGAEPRIDLDFD